MKRPLLSALALIAVSTLSLSATAHAQTQEAASSDTSAEDEAYDEAFDLLTSMALVNENCKGALEPTYYEGFKVLLRVNFGAMGVTDEQLQKQEAATAELPIISAPTRPPAGAPAPACPPPPPSRKGAPNART